MDDRELTYIRDDVAELYSTKELESAVDNSQMESLTVPNKFFIGTAAMILALLYIHQIYFEKKKD